MLGQYIHPTEHAFKECILLQSTLEDFDDLFDWISAKLNQTFQESIWKEDMGHP